MVKSKTPGLTAWRFLNTFIEIINYLSKEEEIRTFVQDCPNPRATECYDYYLENGVWMDDCEEVMTDCGCYDFGTELDCYKQALNYIRKHLTFEPNNACAVLAYVQDNFKCYTPEIVRPETPYPFPDINLPDPNPGSNDHLPDRDGPYDEDHRKPTWWYHTDHLGSSTYLTDNFGRPSHYYETLPFGEMMVEHNQSANVPSGVGYDNKYKFNGKELDDATQMYYYGARYYDPRISIFVSVDPLAEKTMTPYQYVHNNPIMFTDPTGMSAEGSGGGGGFWNKLKSFFGISSTEKPAQQNVDDDSTLLDEIVIDKPKNRGEKVFNLKVQGRDKSIYENDKGIVAGAYRLGKQFKKWSDSILSGGFQFDDDDNNSKGDLNLRRNPQKGQNVQRLNVSGLMQGGRFAKSWDGTGFKYSQENLDLERFTKISNANITGFNLGGTIGDKANKGIDSIRVWLFNGSTDSIPIQLTPSENMMLRNYNSANGDKFRDSLRKKRGYFNTYK